MHHRKYFKKVETPEKSNEELSSKRQLLPFMRASKPAKRCHSPDITESGESPEEPFSHLLHDGRDNRNQQCSDAYRKIGSLSGQQVCRENTSQDHILNHASRITVLPSWKSLVSKRRHCKKKKLQNATAGGPWKTVDEHVAQLKRKSACFDRSTNPIKDLKTENTFSSDSRLDNTVQNCSSSCTQDVLTAIPEPQLTIDRQMNSLASKKSQDSEEGPLWKPLPVVGKLLHTTSAIPTCTESEQVKFKLDLDTKDFLMESTGNDFKLIKKSTQLSSDPALVNRQGHARCNWEIRKPTSTELGFQRVPGNEQPDINTLNSPWPNMWSPPLWTDKFHEE